MNRQDFERYAIEKRINYKVADTWKDLFHEACRRLQKPHDAIKFLDYGCGDGKYFPFLTSEQFTPKNVYGVEVSHCRIDRCKAIGWENVHLLSKGEDLPYEAGSFDLVNFMEVIEHIPREMIGSVLSEIKRVMRPGGLLMVSTPNYPIKRFYDIFDAFVHSKWKRLRDDPTHVTFYDHKKLRGLLDNYFELIDERIFKAGFLYKRYTHPRLLHKLFFICQV